MDNLLTILLILAFVIITVLTLFVLFKGARAPWKEQLKKELDSVYKRFSSNDPIVFKSIIIDADKLLDHVFKHRGLKGETMGERLKNAKNVYDRDTYNNIWEAHKKRNTLVHEMNASINKSEAKRFYKYLEAGIRKLL